MKETADTSLHTGIFEGKPTLSQKEYEAAVGFVLRQIDENLRTFGGKFPSQQTSGNVYLPIENDSGWTTGFWSGMIWLAYEMTGDDRYLREGMRQTESFIYRMNHALATDTHDLGFLYSLSCVACWKLTGDERAKQTALRAADLLMKRYLPKAGIIQAWGRLDDLQSPHRGKMIIDTCMNLPLLYWAGEQTGNPAYRQAALTHARNALRFIVREDSSTFHTYLFDPDTGAPLYGKTRQGYADDSCWARGQAWAMYGFLLTYLYTGEQDFLHAAEKVTDYFLQHLPADLVCYWDLIFGDGSGQQRDSSAAAIAVCALLEAQPLLPQGEWYRGAAEKILCALAKSYTTEPYAQYNGFLMHSVVNKPAGRGLDECSLWGDYFYFEALVRLRKSWKRYW